MSADTCRECLAWYKNGAMLNPSLTKLEILVRTIAALSKPGMIHVRRHLVNMLSFIAIIKKCYSPSIERSIWCCLLVFFSNGELSESNSDCMCNLSNLHSNSLGCELILFVVCNFAWWLTLHIVGDQ